MTGNAEVAYRETITTAADGEGQFVGYATGRGHFAKVRIHLAPGQHGTGYVFANRIERTLPDAIVRAVGGSTRVVTVQVLMSQILGYDVELRRRTHGRGTYSMHLEGYVRAKR